MKAVDCTRQCRISHANLISGVMQILVMKGVIFCLNTDDFIGGDSFSQQL